MSRSTTFKSFYAGSWEIPKIRVVMFSIYYLQVNESAELGYLVQDTKLSFFPFVILLPYFPL